MSEAEWEQARAYIEHSGLSLDEVVKACGQYQAREHFEGDSHLQMALPLETNQAHSG